MSEYKHISGYLEFSSHKEITAVVIALKASEHILEDEGYYYYLDERGHVVDTCDPEGVIDMDTFTIEFPARNYRNLSSRLMGLINEYRPLGEIKIHSEGINQVFAYLNGDSLMESNDQFLVDCYKRTHAGCADQADDKDKCEMCLSGDYEAFEAKGYGSEEEFNELASRILSNGCDVLMGRLRERSVEAA